MLLERASLGSVALVWRHVVRARRVLFYPDQALSRPDHARRATHLVSRLVRWLNPHAEIGEIPQEVIAPLWHRNNQASDRYVEVVWEALSSSPTVAVMRRLVGAEHLDRYYKIRLLPWVLASTLFYRVTRHFLDAGEPLVLVPDAGGGDPCGLRCQFLSDGQWRKSVPRVVRVSLAVREASSRWCNTVLAGNWLRLVAYPLACLGGLLARGRITLTHEPIEADVILPLVNGFREGPASEGAAPDASTLLSGALTPKRVLLYFSDWKFSPDAKREQISIMRRLGFGFADSDRFRADPGWLAQAVRFCFALWLRSARPRVLTEDPRIAKISAALARHLLKERLFARSVAFKVSVEFQDYSPVHVVRTIVANQFGRLTMGVHHGAPAATAVAPVMRYTCMNRLGVWGEAFAKMHGDHWRGMRLVPIGAYRVDLVKAAQASPRWEALSRSYQAVFGGVRPCVVLLLPTLSWYIMRSRAQELLEGLRLLAEVEGPFVVVCRFRSDEARDAWLALGLQEIFEREARIVSDTRHYTTYEWMALADLVISASHSTGLIEAAAAGKRCATFDYTMTGRLAYGKFGDGLILETRDDVVRVIREARAGEGWADAGAAALARAFSYYADGRSLERWRQAVLEAVRDVELAQGVPATAAATVDEREGNDAHAQVPAAGGVA